VKRLITSFRVTGWKESEDLPALLGVVLLRADTRYREEIFSAFLLPTP
jgi:hypothetical protein